MVIQIQQLETGLTESVTIQDTNMTLTVTTGIFTGQETIQC